MATTRMPTLLRVGRSDNAVPLRLRQSSKGRSGVYRRPRFYTPRRETSRIFAEGPNLATVLLADVLWVVAAVGSVSACYFLLQSFLEAKEIVDERREEPSRKEKERQERIKKLTGGENTD